jgi:outer membrane protein OmpA-like peptidoglycan-associated protein
MKFLCIILVMLMPAIGHAQAAQKMSAEEIVEQLSPAFKTRSLSQRAFRLEPRKLDFQIGFDFDSAKVRPDSVPQLEEIARAMNAERLASVRFKIEGHTDAVGTSAYNDNLSDRRARSVVDFLKSKGVDPQRLEAEGKGMRDLADSANPRSAINRRVRIVTIDGG